MSALGQLRLSDLELLISAAGFGSLSEAARRHCLSQSAASAAVQRVERAFGVPLCRHEKRRFRLTNEGAAILERAERWIQQLRTEVAVAGPGPIRLATTHAIARVILPNVIAHEAVELSVCRPDKAYEAVLRRDADLAFVPDNQAWRGVESEEVSAGFFQLYARKKVVRPVPILLPEDQMESLLLQERWEKQYGRAPEIKARLPSWSLIADICASGDEVGFLPDFLARKAGLKPQSWQPKPSPYRILAITCRAHGATQIRLEGIFQSAGSALNCRD